MRSISAWKRRPGCCLAALHSRRCNWRTLSTDSRPPGWLDLGGHALARACVTDLAPARTLRSPRVVRRAAPHYYGPLGLPLRRARFRRWLIRAALPRPGLHRRVSRVSFGSVSACCAPYPAETPVRVRLRTGAHRMSSSPRHDRFDARVVNLTRLQASRDVAARGLAPSVEASDTPLGPRESPRTSGVCYSALRRLPRRDLHPLEMNDGMGALARPHRHDATCSDSNATTDEHMPQKNTGS